MPNPENFDLIADIHHYRQLCLEEPGLPANHYHLGELLQENREYALAIHAYRRASELFDPPEKALALFQIGTCFQASGFVQRAITAFEDVIRLDSQNFAALGSLGQLYFENFDPETAETYFLKALSIKPDDLFAKRQLFVLYVEKKNIPEALKIAVSSLENPKATGEDWGQYALALLKNGQKAEAKGAYEKAIQFPGVTAGLLNNYATCLRALKSNTAAEEVYKQAFGLDKKNPNLWYNFGEFLMEEGETERAFQAFQEVVKLSPEDGEAWFQLAKCFSSQNGQEAEKCLKKAESLHYQSAEFYLLAARLAADQGRLEEVLEHRKRAQLKAPTDKANNTALGLIYLKQGQFNQSWESLKRVHPLEEADQELWVQISQHLRAHSWFEQEFLCLEKLAKLPKPPDYFWQRSGEIALEKGLYNKAHEFFKRREHKLSISHRTGLQLAIGQIKGGDMGGLHSLVPAFFAMENLLPRLIHALPKGQKMDFLMTETWQNPQFLEAYGLFLWAGALYKAGRTQDGEELMQWLGKQNIYPILSELNLVKLHLWQRRLSELSSWLNANLHSQNTGYSWAWLALSQIYLEQIQSAAASIEKALQIEPHNLWALKIKVEIALKSRDSSTAGEIIELLLNLQDTDPENFILKARLAIAKQDIVSAETYINQALHIDRHSSSAWELKGDLAQLKHNLPLARHAYLRALAAFQRPTLLQKLIPLYQVAGENGKAQALEALLPKAHT